MRCIKEKVIHSDKIPAGIFLQGLQYDTSIVNPHWHTQVELNLMLVGSAYFVVNGKKHILREGEMNIINTETVHCGGPLIYGDSMELITLLWDYDFFERFFPDMNDHYFQLANKPEQLRLKHAVADLRNTEDSVTDIAYNNGFPNVNSFISQFKKTYQTTPKQYKKNAFV